MNENSPSRLHVVDALRGFAIVSILLIHNLEHFDWYFLPPNLPSWMVSLDKGIWDTMFFLFAGKSYAIFALLFGLTFFIQSDNQAKKGKDFRGRFAWRLLLLLGFGILNSSFYQGDILTIYAILGFTMIVIGKWSNKAVLITAILFMLQPAEWVNLFVGLQNPHLQMANPASWQYFGKMNEYITGGSFINTVVGNLTNGKLAVYNWTWEAGRVFQAPALFMLGMLAGRKRLFTSSAENTRFWVRTLFVASICFLPLFIVKDGVGRWIQSEAILRPLTTMVTTWSSFAFMLMLVSTFVLLFEKERIQRVLRAIFTPFGQMSLTNYVMQSILGASVYYGFGLGLYKYTGASMCILIGLGLATFQFIFCKWWLASHKQGPLETLWHKGTWINTGGK